MHRWSTHTFKTMCGTPEEEHYMSTVLPRDALRHAFVLDGLFAVTALDMSHACAERERGGAASEEDAARYERLALEYYNCGSATFRALLSGTPPDAYPMMYIFSASAIIMVLGLPEGRSTAVNGGTGQDGGPDAETESDTALGRIITLADLYGGIFMLIQVGWDALANSYYPFREALSTKVDKPDIMDKQRPIDRTDLPYRFASLDLLNDDIKTVLARLDAVNDAAHGIAPTNPDAKAEQAERHRRLQQQHRELQQRQKKKRAEQAANGEVNLHLETQLELELEAEAETETGQDPDSPAGRHEMYSTTIFWLREIFAEAADGRVKGFCLAFFTLMGVRFTEALRAREPVALFIVMHWAVQLDRLGREVWWAEDVGRRLVREISDLLRGPEGGHACAWIAALPDGRDGIIWARQQVGLPP